MSTYEFTLLVGAGAAAAGFLGSLTGLGGGVVIVPLLTLAFGVDLRYAIGASLVAAIATSSGAAAAYVKEGYSNIRVGMLLEIATTCGAFSAALAATAVPASVVAVLFGLVLLVSAYLTSQKPADPGDGSGQPDRLAAWLKLDSTYPTPQGLCAYRVHHVPLGFGLMFVAGVISGLLGIGSGALKVLAMDQAMRLPFKVSTTTSNFMIGVTAAAGAGVYLGRGYIDPALALPVMLGVLIGSAVGAGLLRIMDTRLLRPFYAVLIFLLAIQMIYRGLTGSF